MKALVNIIVAVSLLGFTLAPPHMFPCCCKQGSSGGDAANARPCCSAEPAPPPCCCAKGPVGKGCRVDDSLRPIPKECRCGELIPTQAIPPCNCCQPNVRSAPLPTEFAAGDTPAAFGRSLDAAFRSDHDIGPPILLKTCILTC